jgi:hypothetical protein
MEYFFNFDSFTLKILLIQQMHQITSFNLNAKE